MIEKVVKYIVKDMAPLSTIASKNFRDMLHEFEPRWQAPNRETLIDDLIPSWYEMVKGELLSDFVKVTHVSMTSDAWTSNAQDHYLAFTVHYISEDWVLKRAVLKTKAVYVPQTCVNVAVEIDDVLAEFGIKDKVRMITVDNAANMTVAAAEANVPKLGCSAHILNLAAQKAIDTNEVKKLDQENQSNSFLVSIHKHGKGSSKRKTEVCRSATAYAYLGCEDQVEFDIRHGRSFPWTVLCAVSCMQGWEDQKVTWERPPRNP